MTTTAIQLSLAERVWAAWLTNLSWIERRIVCNPAYDRELTWHDEFVAAYATGRADVCLSELTGHLDQLTRNTGPR